MKLRRPSRTALLAAYSLCASESVDSFSSPRALYMICSSARDQHMGMLHWHLVSSSSRGNINLAARLSDEGSDKPDDGGVSTTDDSSFVSGEMISTLLYRLSSKIENSPQQQQPALATPQVYIIGTGLSNQLTSLPLTTLSILSKARVVLHDALSLPAEEIHKIVPSDCIVRSVGKRGDRQDSVLQSEIDELIIQYATSSLDGRPKYPTIIRLKGGDPFLFGRSRTEIDALRSHDISYKVIPNLSSSVAGPHYGGIPLTDPILKADSFAVFSGTNAQGVGIGSTDHRGKSREWGDMAVDTLVFLMIGRLDKLNQLCSTLINSKGDSWTAETNCAIVRNAGRAEQQVWRATLGTIVGHIRKDLGVDCTTVSPAIFVVGRVTSLDLKGL